MKILVVSPHYYPEHFSITDVAEGLVRRGHEVLVVTGQPNYGMKRIYEGYENVFDEVINGVRVHRCPLYPRRYSRLSIIKNYLSFWHSSKQYLRHLKEEFDVVYSICLSPLIAVSGANIYAKKHKVRHIHHCLDLWPESPVSTSAIEKGSLFYAILYRWSKAIYAKMDEILISSPSFVSYFRDVLKLPDIPVSYVPQPPMIALPEAEVAYTHRYNFVYAGNIGVLQNVEQQIDAMKMAREVADCGLTIIGMGSRVDAIKKKIAEENLSSFVDFEGIKSRSVTASYYQKATAIMVVLKGEGSVGKTIPGKLSSGLFYGKPILAAVSGDGLGLLETTQGAVIAEDESAESLAKAIVKMIGLSEEEREEMGRRNKEYFLGHFEVDKVLDSIEKHLK